MINIQNLIQIAQDAGEIILKFYHQPQIAVQKKLDQSLLTEADLASHDFILQSLTRLYPEIPVLSEESAHNHDFEKRKNWEYFFLVDPLDGTKEFIQKNGEFTVNIALVEKHLPITGVVHAPDLNATYYAEKGKGAYKILNKELFKLSSQKNEKELLKIITSRSHFCAETQAFLDSIREHGQNIVEVTAGSALKFGLIAEGKADIYPRFSPTMEWDTAAGQVLVTEVNKKIMLIEDRKKLLAYNKKELINPGFLVE